MLEDLTVEQYRDAVQQAERTVTAAILEAMREFNHRTGLHIIDVTPTMLIHTDRSGNYSAAITNVLLTNVSIRTNIDHPAA